jgi:hypothetical protein
MKIRRITNDSNLDTTHVRKKHYQFALGFGKAFEANGSWWK